MADGRYLDMSTADMLEATQQETEPVWCGCRWAAYWHHLANTTEPSVCSGNPALSNYFDHLF